MNHIFSPEGTFPWRNLGVYWFILMVIRTDEKKGEIIISIASQGLLVFKRRETHHVSMAF